MRKLMKSCIRHRAGVVRSSVMAVTGLFTLLSLILLTHAYGKGVGPSPNNPPIQDVSVPDSPKAFMMLSADEQHALGLLVNSAFGLNKSEIVDLGVRAQPGEAFSVNLVFEGQLHTLDLQPHSIRSANYQILVQQADGSIVPAPPGPERTLRGTVRGRPGSAVAASLMKDGLHARVVLGNDDQFWVEPIARLLPGVTQASVLYRSDEVIPTGGICGMADQAVMNRSRPEISDGALALGTGTPQIAELACDADVEYYNNHGSSVQQTVDRINLVINTVNLQYELQVGLTHQITTIIVRTADPDPYNTTTDAIALLCEFITEWTINQVAIQRDLAHLFTGKDLSPTIGLANDIGGTGICVSNGSCGGGPVNGLGSYCLAQSDWNVNFACDHNFSARTGALVGRLSLHL